MVIRKIMLKPTAMCVICGEEYEGYGNNALPVKEGECCDQCNLKVVVPERVRQVEEDSS